MTIGNEELIRPAMLEVIAIAKSVGVECDPTLIDKYLHIGDGFFIVHQCVLMYVKDN